jgi:hypothetical protein
VLVRRRLHSGSRSSRCEDTQFRCVLRNFETIRERVPRLTERPKLVEDAAFRVCLARGVRDIQALRLPEAREKLWRAVTYKPFSVKAWAAFTVAHTPRWTLDKAKRALKRQLRGGLPA